MQKWVITVVIWQEAALGEVVRVQLGFDSEKLMPSATFSTQTRWVANSVVLWYFMSLLSACTYLLSVTNLHLADNYCICNSVAGLEDKAQQPQPQYDFHYQNVKLIKTESLGIGSYGAVCKAMCDDLPCAAKIFHPALF